VSKFKLDIFKVSTLRLPSTTTVSALLPNLIWLEAVICAPYPIAVEL
jgi:hypothetical protein